MFNDKAHVERLRKENLTALNMYDQKFGSTTLKIFFSKYQPQTNPLHSEKELIWKDRQRISN